jgi:enoyl-CoA hydratase/carnithine racemase
MFIAIRDAAKKLAEHRDVRAVVLHGAKAARGGTRERRGTVVCLAPVSPPERFPSGEGRAFCAGLDVKSILASGSAAKQLLERTGEANLAQEVSYLWCDPQRG